MGTLGSVGKSRITRIRNSHPNDSKNSQVPWNAFTKEEKQMVKEFVSTLPVEDGFPCSHRVPKQYVTLPEASWYSLHQEYVSCVEESGRNLRAFKYHRFTHWVHKFFPNLRLHRSSEDERNCCTKIKLLLEDPPTSPEQKEELDKQLKISRWSCYWTVPSNECCCQIIYQKLRRWSFC